MRDDAISAYCTACRHARTYVLLHKGARRQEKRRGYRKLERHSSDISLLICPGQGLREAFCHLNDLLKKQNKQTKRKTHPNFIPSFSLKHNICVVLVNPAAAAAAAQRLPPVVRPRRPAALESSVIYVLITVPLLRKLFCGSPIIPRAMLCARCCRVRNELLDHIQHQNRQDTAARSGREREVFTQGREPGLRETPCKKQSHTFCYRVFFLLFFFFLNTTKKKRRSK